MEIHASGLLPTLIVSLIFAFVAGVAARALRLPPLVGYLLAGVIVGPFTPGFVANQKIANELAEIGVALLLFGVGLHFSPSDLWRARRVAIPGALLQMAITISVGYLAARFLIGASQGGAAIVGLCLAIASTAVATRALAERGRLDTPAGRIALGWLVVQDIVVILALVLVPLVLQAAKLDSAALAANLGQVALQLMGFVVVMSVLGRRFIPWLLGHVARLGSRELFTLAVITVALGIAGASTVLFGVSLTLGAFVAGVVLGESDLSHQAAAETRPIQQIFTVLFFVSIGMLFDPTTLWRMPFQVAAMLAAILVGAGLSTLLILLAMRRSVETAALVGAAFSQIGEFSFILTEVAGQIGLIDANLRNLVLAAALLSILVNPLVFYGMARLAPRVAAWPALRRWRDNGSAEVMHDQVALAGHAILVGHGRVGSLVGEALLAHHLPFVVIESDRTRSELLRAKGRTVIYGDATRQEVLAAASPTTARLLVVALPDAFHARHVVALVRKLNPRIETVVRTHSEEEAAYLEQEESVGLVVMGEREVALSMTDFTLQALGVASADAQSTVNAMRRR